MRSSRRVVATAIAVTMILAAGAAGMWALSARITATDSAGASAGVAGPAPARAITTQNAPQATRAAASAYGRLPLAFVAGARHSRSAARIIAQGAGFAAGLTDNGLLLSLRRTPTTHRTLQMRFVGAAPAAGPVAARPLPGHANYLVGADRRHWRTNVPTYAAAAYRGIWPGIDATFSGLQHELEYTFRVAPGADAGRIQLDLTGQTGLHLDARGTLALSAGPGLAARQLAPRSFQVIDGRHVAVPSRYALHGHRLAIAVGRYDHARPLIIDPTFAVAYATYLGGGDLDQGSAIALDPTGEAFVTGTTSSTDFATTGAAQTTAGGNQDAFVTKLSADGTKVLYTTYLGGSQLDQGNGIAVDASGDAYVTGYTESSDFPTANPLQSTPGDGRPPDSHQSVFVSKLNPAGSALAYSTYLGGCCFEFASSIAVDAHGAAYVTGQTRSFDFPVSANAYQTNDEGPSAFATKLSPTDTLDYSTFLSGDYTTGNGIAVNASGQAWVGGLTANGGYPTTTGAFQTTGTVGDGGSTGFVTEFNADATAIRYSTFLGGTSANDAVTGVALDPAGDPFVTGWTASEDFPTTAGAVQRTFGGANTDAFVTEFTSDGTVAYSTYLGGAGDDQGNAIATDAAGDAFVTGFTGTPTAVTTVRAQASGTGFPLANPTQATPGAGQDAFVSELAPGGGAFTFSTYLGGSGDDAGAGIAADAAGSAYVTGSTQSADFPTVNPAQNALRAGDAFVAKITSVAYPLTVTRAGTGSGTVTSAPPGIACGVTCAASFAAGTDVTLTEAPSAGSTFDGWSGAGCSGATSTCTVPMSAAQAVTATFSAQTSTITAPGNRTAGVPVNVSPPVISGTPLPGSTLHCSTGTWTNDATSFTYVWKLAEVPIAGATGNTYLVTIGDEASGPSDTLTCVVTASNPTGPSQPATSNAVLVAVAGTGRCPLPSGRLRGSNVGVLKLGMTKSQARHRLTRFNVTQNKFDNFCLYAGWGIRVAYPSAALLKSVSKRTARRAAGRIVIALTANPFYRYRGTPPGTRLALLAKRVKLGKPFHIGVNYWYIASAKPSNAVFKVRDGVVQEDGLVSRALTGSRAAQKRLLHSFKNG
jgi:hypothetical protein